MTNPLKGLFKPKVCLDCNESFKPTCGTAVRCPECRPAHAIKYKHEYQKRTSAVRTKKAMQWAKENPEKSRDIKRKWNWSDNGRKLKREWYLKNKHKMKPLTDKQRKRISSRTTALRRMKRSGAEKICTNCGKTEGRIELHHIDFDVFNNELSNFQYLCKKHHMDKHHDKNLANL